MLEIIVQGSEKYDDVKNEFISIESQTLKLEHSLVSISKWESKWKKPFISRDPKTEEESLDYVRCMTVNPNVDPSVYYNIPSSVFESIRQYIDDPMTATWISGNENRPPSRQIITSELIYYWMVSYRIPMECQKWHLNRLLMLIQVCDEKNRPQKKMSRNQILSRNAALNAARRAKMHSKG